ncbi:MAG: CheR family methyltransferase [Phycisphaerales bacterium]
MSSTRGPSGPIESSDERAGRVVPAGDAPLDMTVPSTQDEHDEPTRSVEADVDAEVDADVDAGGADGDADAETEAGVVPFIIGIGASAGGLRPLQDFFGNMPGDSGAAFVVVQHLSPDFKSLMPELLGRLTEMKAVRIEDGMRPEPNTIYLNSPRSDLVLVDGAFRLRNHDPSSHSGPSFPIDLFFRSLAAGQGDRTIGVIMSGSGSDGSRGVREISEVGGVVLAQDPGTSQFDGMPQATITTGYADAVQAPVDLARSVYAYVQRAGRGFPRREPDSDDPQAADVDRIIAILEKTGNIDFSHYKRTTVGRRIERRRLLSGSADLTEYIEQLSHSAVEQDALRNDLLITVTSFFRDSEAWDILSEQILPRLLRDAPPDRPFRIWVTACATGEEAYSIAMLVTEVMERENIRRDVKIFATDIDEKALERASAGVFPRAIVGDLSEERLRRFFVWKDGHYEVSRDLREKIIFARHNISRDAPFIQMDLVSCRNVLIYMQNQLQQKVVRLLHFALNLNGCLFMGSADVVGALANEFEVIDSTWSLFRKRRDVRLVGSMDDLHPARSSNVPLTRRSAPVRSTDSWTAVALGRVLDSREGLAMVIGPENELVQSYGRSETYLRVPRGPATNDVTRMLSRPLQLPMLNAFKQIRTGGHSTPIEIRGVGIDIEGRTRSVTMIVALLTPRFRTGNVGTRSRLGDAPSMDHLLVTIEQDPEPDEPRAMITTEQLSEHEQARIAELENELSQVRESLQSTIEELESTNEEQQAGNEELLASNEELQSTNEELHSLNEELYTVNAEYQAKIQELTELHHDMNNLLMSTNIGTIFLDRELRVRKFTPAATEAFNLVDVDINRPIEHLSHNLEYPHLFDDLRTVLATGRSLERDTATKQGRPLLVRMNPYRTEQSDHDGLVVTFIDISELREAERDLSRQGRELTAANEELERFGRLAVSREDRILALKRQVNKMAELLGDSAVYDLSFVAEEVAEPIEVAEPAVDGSSDGTAGAAPSGG